MNESSKRDQAQEMAAFCKERVEARRKGQRGRLSRMAGLVLSTVLASLASRGPQASHTGWWKR